MGMKRTMRMTTMMMSMTRVKKQAWRLIQLLLMMMIVQWMNTTFSEKCLEDCRPATLLGISNSGHLSENQGKALNEVITLANQRQAAQQSKAIEQQGGYQFSQANVPGAFSFGAPTAFGK